MNRTPENGMERGGSPLVTRLEIGQLLLNQVFAEARAASWGIDRDAFAATLHLSAKKHFVEDIPPVAKLEGYFFSLHLQDLALACGCAQGNSAAWDYFVSTYRGYLRSAAGIILHCPPDSPAAQELADSLFAELYGISEGANRRSLFRYFHGRSSLKTWLRAVLAQRHIDAVRVAKRFASLDEPDGEGKVHEPADKMILPPSDPHRSKYLKLFQTALVAALEKIEMRDRERLKLYYLDEKTLAEIGKKLGEHESSVSRNLDRVRRELREDVEGILGKPEAGSALSAEQIALCFEYAAEDAPIDLGKLLKTERTGSLQKGKQEA